LPGHINFYESEFLNFGVKLIPVIFSLSGAGFAYIVYHLLNK